MDTAPDLKDNEICFNALKVVSKRKLKNYAGTLVFI